MFLLFGVAGVAGNALGGYDADRWGYWRSLATIYTTLTLSLFAFSLPTPVAGSPLAAAGNGVALVARACPGALMPFQQYLLIDLTPRIQNVVLSLNASSTYLGQGRGAGLGYLAILYGSLASLGWVTAL